MKKIFRFIFCLVPFLFVFSVSSFALSPDPDLYVVGSFEINSSSFDGYYTESNIINSLIYKRLSIYTDFADYVYIDVPSDYPLPDSYTFSGFCVGTLPDKGSYSYVSGSLYNSLIDIPDYFSDVNYPFFILSIPWLQYPVGVTPPTITVYLLSDSPPVSKPFDISDYDVIHTYTMANLPNQNYVNMNGQIINTSGYRSNSLLLDGADYVYLESTYTLANTGCGFSEAYGWGGASGSKILLSTPSINHVLLPVPSGYLYFMLSINYNHKFNLYFLKSKQRTDTTPSYDSDFSPDLDNPDIGSGDDLSTDLPVIDFVGGGSVVDFSSAVPVFGNGVASDLKSGLSSSFDSDGDLFLDPSDGLPFSEFMSVFMSRGVFGSFWPLFLFSLLTTIIMGIIKALMR